ncbi:DUF805 domain-containing protein [Citromicrobium bathyomarinum]|jgi:uncharacterized membrane protein YhaH (DUF805 family)|uniref:DUF805 domain-containing protein n=1 Tax=Sphingomonadales TaxID=204457 RepID=UPI000C65D8F6|nr:DUF805 domain-containing protein [Citromicrobium sp.]MBO81641.1 DUF805 domain-containing protein [Citromicrobium sp.]|tara:strand:+ start:19492 stop:19950 length:459 start_codon:yes stop_codon:yes gene_type:complete
MEWMILPLKRYFDFQGRSRRLEFWMFALLNVIVFTVLSVIVFGTGATMSQIEAADPNDLGAIYGSMFSGLGLLFIIWWLIILIPSISVSVRRLHDRNMTGWWYLGFIVLSLIPLIGFVASIAYIVVMALPGTPGPNKYGPSPKEGVTAETFE